MTREKKKQEKRATILEAARGEFEAKRFDEVKLDDIALRAGVGKGTLYLYFKNKEDLFVQMAVDGVDEMAERMKEITAMDQPFRERFFQFGREVGEFVESRSAMFRLMHQVCSDGIKKEFAAHHRQLVLAAREFLRVGIEEGALCDDYTPAQLHCSLIGPLLFRFRLNEFSEEQIAVEPLLRLFWEGASKK